MDPPASSNLGIDSRLLHQMHFAVGRAAGAAEVEAADVGALVANPVLAVGVDVDLDGTSAVLPDSVSNLGLLGHFFLLGARFLFHDDMLV